MRPQEAPEIIGGSRRSQDVPGGLSWHIGILYKGI